MKQFKILLTVFLIAILLCACATTNDNVGTNSEKSSVSKTNISQNNADYLLNSFISLKKYLKYTTNKHRFSYTIADLNSDGVNELLMQCEEEKEFHDMWIFAIQNNSVSLVFEYYGFGSFMYSPSQNAVIVPPDFRPFNGASNYGFYTLDGNEMKFKFSVGESDIYKYFIRTDSDSKEITNHELSSYFTDAVDFEWIKIS